MPIGLDIGTYNIVQAIRDGDEVSFKREINAFVDIPVEQEYMLNMLKSSGAPVVQRDRMAYILGKAAVELALSMNRDICRPMYQGVLSVSEKEAFNILSIIIRSMVGKITQDEVVYYSVPADAVNTDTSSSYHQKVLQSILDGYNHNGKRLIAKPINEALAIVIAELADQGRTGLGISFGAGMVNLCYAMFSLPIVQFSRTNSGDWVDREASKATGENPTFINKRKESIDFSQEPRDSIDRAIKYHYELLIENGIKDIAGGIKKAGAKANPGKPIDVVLAGGTASPKGFTEFFESILRKMVEAGEFPLEVGKVKLAPDHLYTVAKGCLIAAEADSDAKKVEKKEEKPKEEKKEEKE